MCEACPRSPCSFWLLIYCLPCCRQTGKCHWPGVQGMALTLFSAAYLSEIIRSGLQSVPAGADRSGGSVGPGLLGTQWRVVWPQALRAVLPALVSHAIGLLKDTSGHGHRPARTDRWSVIGLGGDPVWRPFYLEAYLFVAAVYACLCLGLAWVGRRLEANWQRG